MNSPAGMLWFESESLKKETLNHPRPPACLSILVNAPAFHGLTAGVGVRTLARERNVQTSRPRAGAVVPCGRRTGAGDVELCGAGYFPQQNVPADIAGVIESTLRPAVVRCKRH